MLLLLTFAIICTTVSAQWDPNFVLGRNTIVHLFEWKWTDIEKECTRFLGPEGFGGVQVSPPNENVVEFTGDHDRPWSERYTPVSYKLETRSGTEEEFRNMVTTCNNANVRVYVDAVINHMSGLAKPEGYGTAGSYYNYNTMVYEGVPYSAEDFNGPNTSAACSSESGNIEDWLNPIEVRNCRLGTLIDLNQGTPHVREKLLEYFNNLTSIGVAGFRIDASKFMWPADLKLIYDQLNNLPTSWFPSNSKPFIYQEVTDLGGDPITREEYIGMGRVTEFKYSEFIGQVFRKRDGMALKDLANYEAGWGGLLDSNNALTFVDNHDNQREGGGRENVVTFRANRLYKQAQAFTLAIPYGISRVMSSYFWEQDCEYGPLPDGACVGGVDRNAWIGPPHDDDYNILDVIVNEDMSCGNGWVCEHRWREIWFMVKFRNIVEGTLLTDWYDNGKDQIAFCRGQRGFIAINNDVTDMNVPLKTCVPPGTYCDIISGGVETDGISCVGKTISVNSSGYSDIFIASTDNVPIIAFHIESKIN